MKLGIVNGHLIITIEIPLYPFLYTFQYPYIHQMHNNFQQGTQTWY